jgi:hypothetical protein
VSWNGTNLSEPTNLSVSGASATVVDVSGRSASRLKVYESSDVDLGTVSVEALVGSLGTGSLGEKAALSVSGGGVSYGGPAIFEGLEFACTVGGVTRFTYKFRMSGA